MGITGELVRSVFSKSRSIPRHATHDNQASSIGSEKRKWKSSVRSYLCGDEHSSVLAAEDSAPETETVSEFASFRSNIAMNQSRGTGDTETAEEEDSDSASVRSSEATVDQPLEAAESILSDEMTKEKQNSTYTLFKQEDAALIIQSAFRNFMARVARDEEKSIGTSIEVQTGNSCDVFSIKEESKDTRQTIRRRSGSQVLKIQEDWDDSTVSSVQSKMRMQNRLEAATRRERALAYAFSQQLRICSKKQRSVISSNEANMGWNWLERWMAARQPEINNFISTDDHSTKAVVRKRSLLDAAMEEKESCGSNEVSVSVSISLPKNVQRPTNKATTQAKRSFSMENSASSHLSPKESKDVKKGWHVEEEKEKRKRQKQPAGNKRDVKDAITAAPQVAVQ